MNKQPAIELKNITCSNLIVSCTTGDIEINDSIVNENIELSATTGEIEIERLTCNKLTILCEFTVLFS